MKKLLFTVLAAAPLLSLSAKEVKPAIAKDKDIEAKVEALLKKMTLEEKIGQMTEIVVDKLGKPGNWDNNGFEIDEKMLDLIIGKYKVGSLLNAPGTGAMSKEKWQQVIAQIQEKSMKEIGIPCIYGLDQIHGTTYILDGTMFPQGVNMAASFNPELVKQAAIITAYETKAASVPWTYTPTIDLCRDQRWSRHWESYGEDSYLTAQMGKAAIEGFQGSDPNNIGKNNIAVSLKHYMGYSAPFSGKDRTPAYISEQDLREKHFAPFLEGVKAGALSVMVNSGSINGLPTHANYELMTQWLKKDLNWDGVIVTDWADINNLYKREKIAADKKEAIKIAINAGIDMAMEPYECDFCDLLKELVKEGEVKMSRIDDATKRVLRMKFRLGLFENPTFNLKDYPNFGCKAFADTALKAAEESMVLLKNTDNLLPLAKGKKILLAGPNANSMRTLNGGWSYTWQGHRTDEFTAQYNTILESLCQKFGNENVIYEAGVTYRQGGSYWEENEPEIQKAVLAAGKADIIVACIGENSYCETPGNLTDLTISKNQRELVKALASTGKPVILILNEGRPRLVAEIEPLAKAVVNIMLPGNYGGDALANLLSGDANFSGKLPYTYPKEINSLASYDYKVSEEVETMDGAYNYDAVMSAQWAFGFGLSYTNFAYSNLRISKTRFSADDVLSVKIDVKNTGSRAGKESVMLFSSDLIASLTPDMRRLRAFEKVYIQPGQSKTVELKIKASDLAFVGYDGKWVLEKGDFRIQVGNQVQNIQCTQTKKWDTPNK